MIRFFTAFCPSGYNIDFLTVTSLDQLQGSNSIHPSIHPFAAICCANFYYWKHDRQKRRIDNQIQRPSAITAFEVVAPEKLLIGKIVFQVEWTDDGRGANAHTHIYIQGPEYGQDRQVFFFKKDDEGEEEGGKI